METAPANTIIAPTTHMIALDIDGTLVDRDNKIPTETVQALELVRASGHQVVLATGRSLVGLVSIARRLGLTQGWAVCSNGALTVRLDPAAPSGYEVVEARTFDAGPVIRQASKLSPGVHVAIEEIGWGWRVNRQFAPGLLNGPQKQTPREELVVGQVSRVALHADRLTDHTELLRGSGATVTPAGRDWVDATASDTSKAIALERVRGLLGIAPEHTVAVGDGVNDIPMLAWAARGVAMGQASGAVREAAKEITGPIAANGAVPVLLSLVPVQARRPGLSPLGAQLAAAVHTAVASAPGPVVVRVWHGSSPDLAGCEVHSLHAGEWVRQAPVPAGTASTMRDVERAAREAGLAYPQGDEGRRRAHWRTAAAETQSARPAEFELPLATRCFSSATASSRGRWTMKPMPDETTLGDETTAVST
ncbi:hydroxymethylpyrimidine pyrophosphatase-like HAD family hydrolase [Promicromonospora sp. AC04]|uniref:HAD family hydrolase n=1 Tax=Promicromonospora sp. AC04 TaxID=2135723 RepID=UPI000D4FA99B|nr:HAD family hydrolase [Promicromonospora sp. AC04]PUB24905.1 hydroxymethylpyrimidine pyrophosphatase-like HAD family hydrolase [Promicromonospora sp. AC04]